MEKVLDYVKYMVEVLVEQKVSWVGLHSADVVIGKLTFYPIQISTQWRITML